ncbi:cyclophilin-like protein [Punctularia strigosozonata HHB-11173 SS5]|uniref:cyclophilin-like protein n=1 Tax=Punctularia strigosozonata (strain HHB-11173) TaxID=741275 RepID=UPI0004416798|nr:cyclophilin-like protein [Punctularia strigosozonata HHB-11173 SS5]EIN09466.1 cyclophilin-like protein [Punctularia strigosozonata HHB-11173 SS5]
MALPTKGRVIVETTVGELDIELWSKEAPKACRNFVQLAMEGYYDGVIFHRVVPDFLVQTGDRTGTGGGGESIYGEPFEDEIHPRLRFTHRGLVACANNGDKNSNDSQFFITLDRADELHGKHTLFGRCIGDTIYNVLKIGATEIDKNGRPTYPPKIRTIRIVDNPFPDIVPRITAEEKRAQQKAREAAQQEREEAARRKGAKKDVKLLSFGEDEGLEEEEPVVLKKRPIVRPDLVDNPDARVVTELPDFIAAPLSKADKPSKLEPEAKPGKSAKAADAVDITKIREQHAREQDSKLNSRKAEIEKMEADIRKLARRTGDESDDEPARKKPKKSYLDEELSKYAKGKGIHSKKVQGKRKNEGDILATLNKFRSKLQQSSVEDKGDEAGEDETDAAGAPQATGEDPGVEVDTDAGFLGHLLHFPKDNSEEVQKAERDYEVIDPRARGARAKEEERERKRASMRGKGAQGARHRR